MYLINITVAAYNGVRYICTIELIFLYLQPHMLTFESI